jgi:hypothetical protein
MSLTKEQIAAFKEELRLEGQACEGYTEGVVAALVYIITNACSTISAKNLEGLPDQALWQLACTAHEKREYLVHNLPDAVRLSRDELFAIQWGLEKRTADLPTGIGLIELAGITHGPLMARCLHAITHPLSPRIGAPQ